MNSTPDQAEPSTPSGSESRPFHDLDAYLAMPRISGLTVSPDGHRLVTSVATLDAKSTHFITALWEIDPTGKSPARRLTRGAKGESSAAFTNDGSLLFTAKRADPEAEAPDDDVTPLWVLPAEGGEARVVTAARGGFKNVQAARRAPIALITAPMLPGATDLSTDDALRKARKDTAVAAILHSGYPVRFWDHDLGPDAPHLLVGDLSGLGTEEAAGRASTRLELTDLAPSPGAALFEVESDISQDGRWAVSTWRRVVGRGDQRSEIALIDLASGERSALVAEPDADLSGPKISPDGTCVVFTRESLSTPQSAPKVTLNLITLADREVRELTTGWDRWPSGIAWAPDGSAVLMTADQDGRGPVFRIDLATTQIEQLTTDDFTYTDLAPAPDGSAVYALRSSYLAPSHPVRIALTGSEAGTVTVLRAPTGTATPAGVPGTLEDVRSTAADGTPIRGWLAMPSGAGPDNPAPLLLWIHGGPLGSWNAWSWRWNPWLMVAQGYAVLLPDPALSTGYGQEFVQRGWGAWGQAPFTDLMDITDTVVARPDIDAEHTAAMGGSFGGYMANWVAGHTDRFRAIVTHASLWSLDEFGPSTDVATYWEREMSAEMTAANSPHLHVDKITTPMLVIHGDKDYRVPLGQGIRLWYELLSASGLPADENGQSPHRFLYFPDENHWVLSPQHAKIWYQVALGFLAEHVLGKDSPELPALLGGAPAS